MWQLWLIASGIFFVCEIITVGFLIFWLGVGALIAMIVSFFTNNLIIQFAVFVISSCLLIFLTKPFIEKFVTKNDKKVNTNVYSIIGKTGIVIEEINPILGKGQIKIGSEIWSATTENESIIPEQTEIEILKINGVKAIVKEKIVANKN